MAPSSTCRADATHIGAGVFAVADGADDEPGSGERALFHLLRHLGLPSGAQRLYAALRAANWSLWHESSRAPQRPGGATVTAAAWIRSHFVIGHVGDSRAYLLRDGYLTQLTSDQVRVDGWVPLGASDEDRCVNRLGRHQANEGVALFDVAARVDDRLLLCTDGLWRTLSDNDLATLLSGDVRQACAALEERAGEDLAEEASAVVIAVEGAAWHQDRGPS